MVAPAAPNPSRAGSPAEFVAQMRRLKEWSGLGYKQLEARARRLGDVLPHSTLSTALGREALPRTDLLAAFARACGCGPAEVEHWLETRARLLAGDPPPEQPPSPTSQPRQPVVQQPPTPVPLPVSVVALPARSAPPPDRYRGRVRGALAVACVFAVGAGAVGAVLGIRRLVDPGDDGRSVAFVAPATSRSATVTASPVPPSQPPLPAPAVIARETGGSSSSSAVSRDPTQPADGWYRLRPAHAYSSKLCLDLAEKSNRLILVTAACSKATDQQYRVEATGRSVERIRPRSTRLGRNACVGVDAAAGDGRAYLRTCGDLHASQVFTVERTRVTSTTGPLYRFRPTAHPARCFSIAGRSTKAGAELREEECTGGSNQEFALEKA